jgi:hypothetical protein
VVQLKGQEKIAGAEPNPIPAAIAVFVKFVGGESTMAILPRSVVP